MYLGHMSRQISSFNPDPTQDTSRSNTLRGRPHELIYGLVHRQTLVLGQFPDPYRGLLPDRDGVPALFRQRSPSVIGSFKFDRSITLQAGARDCKFHTLEKNIPTILLAKHHLISTTLSRCLIASSVNDTYLRRRVLILKHLLCKWSI